MVSTLTLVGLFPWLPMQDAASVPPPTAVQEEPAEAKRRGQRGERSIPEIVVTGTLEEEGVPIVPLEHPASRDVLGPEAVRRTGARDLNDLMQHLPAVSTRPYNGGDSSAPSFSMRGLPDDGLTEYILVLIDGVPASPMPYGWTAFSFFPLVTEQVYAIDLIRGGHSVRYSPNTVGGVLNLITPPIPGGEAYELRSTTGSNGYQSTLFSAGDYGGKFGYLVTLGDRHGDGYRDDGGFEYQLADVKLRWSWGPGDWLAWRFGYVENEHQAPGGLTQAEFDKDPFANSRPDNRFQGFRAVTDVVRHVEGDDGYVEWFGWLSQTRRNLRGTRPFFGPPTEVRVVDDDAYSLAAGVRGEQRLEALGLDHTLYWGVRAAEELLPNRTTTVTPIPPGPSSEIQDAEYELTALSAHVDDTLRPVDDLTLVAGLRAEWIPIAEADDQLTGKDFDEEFFDVLPGLSASYRLSDSVALFTNYQRSFRAPQVWGFDTSSASPDQDLEFEHGASWELGVRAITGEGWSGSLALWQTDFDDVAFFGPTNVYENIGDIRSEGIDLVVEYDFASLSGALEGLSFTGSVTVQDSEIVEAANPANDGNETPYAWEEKAAWSLQYTTEERWRFALGGVYVGESFSDDANTSAPNANGNLGLNPSRTVWDAQISREVELGEKAHLRFALGATNVFDEEWFVHSRGGFFGPGLVAGPPRQLYFALTLGF